MMEFDLSKNLFVCTKTFPPVFVDSLVYPLHLLRIFLVPLLSVYTIFLLRSANSFDHRTYPGKLLYEGTN